MSNRRDIKKERARTYKKEDWDKLSIIHYLHRKFTGVALIDELVTFYIGMIVLTLIMCLFFKI